MDGHPSNLITAIHSAMKGRSSDLWTAVHTLTFVYLSTFRTPKWIKIRHIEHKSTYSKFSVFQNLFQAFKNIEIMST